RTHRLSRPGVRVTFTRKRHRTQFIEPCRKLFPAVCWFSGSAACDKNHRSRGQHHPAANDQPPLVRFCHALTLFLASAKSNVTVARTPGSIPRVKSSVLNRGSFSH